MLSALRRAMTAAQRTALERMPALDVAQQHAAILAAVEAGDAEGAARAMAAHLAAARAALS
jgi:DNA-binding FadR family transcriptional regulator